MVVIDLTELIVGHLFDEGEPAGVALEAASGKSVKSPEADSSATAEGKMVVDYQCYSSFFK